MSILTREEILKEIELGNIKIDPFSRDQVGPGSVDLYLDNKIRIFKKIHKVFHVTEEADYREITELVVVRDFFLLMPGETALGITRETITLSPSICGWLEGRSRYARLGLLVHITAGFMQPGINNKQILEMSNVSPIPLAIHPGTPICQFIFQRTVGEATYRGKFSNQDTL